MAVLSSSDPSADATLKVFADSLDFALTKDFTEQKLLEAKLLVFKELDCPFPAGWHGLQAFLTGIDGEKSQAHTELLFSVDEAGVKKAAQQLKHQLEQSVALGRAVLGPKETSKWTKTSDQSLFFSAAVVMHVRTTAQDIFVLFLSY
ncbi:unnamed protein product [Mesocestoides corti]|uniref:COMM domain-containing protein n=1 Tax=Mesocestoides corti TaxID=53468 RepID=A0A0R3UE47_MESCO|nr:unnamed protein product [Mesocestoides corti]